MTFITTVSEDAAEGETAEFYAGAKDEFGYLPNFIQVFSHRPDVLARFDALLDSIKEHMDPRRYELVTIAAAKELRSSYCMLMHGAVLMRDHYSADELREIAEDPEASGLDETDKAIMRFARKVVRDATSVSEADLAPLRAQGLTDPEIFDISAAAAARCFITKLTDSVGTRPDARFGALEPGLRKALVVGRPIAD